MNSDRPSEDDDATQILPSASQTTAQSPPAADAVPIPAEVNPTSAIPDLRKALRTYGSNRSKHDERTPTVERSFPDLDDFDFADPEVRKDVASAERPLSTENAVATNNMDHAGGVLSPSDNGDGDYEDEDVPSYSRKRGRVGAMKRRIAASGLQDDEEPEGQEETEAPPETNVSDVQRKDLIREKLRAMAAREREKLEQSQRGARNSELSGDEGPVEEPHAVPAEDQIDAHAQLPEGLFEELSGDDAAAASDGDEEDDGMRDSDGNLLDEEPSVPISAPKKRLKKSLNQKEKLELKKQTEALLRSAEIELPKRQGKFTMDNFLASRGIVRKPGRVESVPEVTSPGGMVTAAVPNPAEATTIKTESPARPSPRKNLPLKSDKVVSRSEFADMQKANAALSRQLMMNIELADDDAALSVDDEDDADALEIIDVLAEPNIKEEGQKHNPFAYAAKPTKKALLNRELMHKNQVLARQRRVMEEEAARAAEEARKKRREEKKAERHAVKVEAGPKTDGERKTDADADHDEDDIVEMHVGSQEPPADTNGDETDNERKNENGEHGRPLVRRLFSDLDRTPFAVLFSKPEQDDSDDDDALDRDRERRKMPSERVRVGEDEDDEDNDGFDDNEDITLEPKPPSEYTQSVRLPAPISLQYSYSLDMDPPDLFSIDDTQTQSESQTQPLQVINTASPPKMAFVVPENKRVGRMQSKTGSKPKGIAAYFNTGGSEGGVSQAAASASAVPQPVTHDARHMPMEESADMPPSSLAQIGPLRSIAGINEDGDEQSNTQLLDMLSGGFGDPDMDAALEVDQDVEMVHEPAAVGAGGLVEALKTGMEDMDDSFAELLRDDSDDEETGASDDAGERGKGDRHSSVVRPPVVTIVPPQVVDDEDDDDTSSESDDDQDGAGNTQSSAPNGSQNDESAPQKDQRPQPSRHLAAWAAERPRPGNAFIDSEAQEEEDAFFGLGGADDPDDHLTLDADLDGLVVSDESDVEGFEDVLELHRQQAQSEHEKGITELLNDVTTGNLRKRKARRRRQGGEGFLDDDSDEDDEALLAKIRGRHAFNGGDGEEGEEEKGDLSALAANPATSAFAKCFDNGCAVKEGFLSSDEEVAEKKLGVRFGRRRGSRAEEGDAEVGNASEPKQRSLPRFASWPLYKSTKSNDTSQRSSMIDDDGVEEEDGDVPPSPEEGAIRRPRLRRAVVVPDSDSEGDGHAEQTTGDKRAGPRAVATADTTMHSDDAASDGAMEVDRQGVDVLMLMMERKRARVGGLVGGRSEQFGKITRTLDSARIFRKRAFLSTDSTSTAKSNTTSTTSKAKPTPFNRSHSAISGFGNPTHIRSDGTRRGNTGFRIGGGPTAPVDGAGGDGDGGGKPPIAKRASESDAGDRKAKRKKGGTEEKGMGLAGLFSRQGSFR